MEAGLLGETLPGDICVGRGLCRPGALPSALFWGRDYKLAGGSVGDLERKVLEDFSVSETWLESSWAPKGSRRAVRFHLHNPKALGGKDEHGDFVETSFTLPSGMFAT